VFLPFLGAPFLGVWGGASRRAQFVPDAISLGAEEN